LRDGDFEADATWRDPAGKSIGTGPVPRYVWAFFAASAFFGDDRLLLDFRVPAGHVDPLKAWFFSPSVAKADLDAWLGVSASPASAPAAALQSPSTAPVDIEPLRNQPGNGGVKIAAAIAAMIAAVKQGTTSYDALRGMREKELVTLYPDAGRTLLRDARREALRRLAPNGLHRQSSDTTPTK
jgi:hypothetical protein